MLLIVVVEVTVAVVLLVVIEEGCRSNKNNALYRHLYSRPAYSIYTLYEIHLVRKESKRSTTSSQPFTQH